MANIKRNQLLTLSLIATLLSFTPLLSTSFRSTYLYFIINVLIVVLGAQAGILSPSSSSTSSKTLEVDKKSTTTTTTTNNNASVNEEENKGVVREKLFVVENYVPEKILVCVDEVKKMIKKCPSTPSLFFIGGNENEEEKQLQEDEEDEDEMGVYDVEEEEEEENEKEDQKEEELFVKAETFIVNFYKQLKMQREDSWKNFREFAEKNNLIS